MRVVFVFCVSWLASDWVMTYEGQDDDRRTRFAFFSTQITMAHCGASISSNTDWKPLYLDVPYQIILGIMIIMIINFDAPLNKQALSRDQSFHHDPTRAWQTETKRPSARFLLSTVRSSKWSVLAGIIRGYNTETTISSPLIVEGAWFAISNDFQVTRRVAFLAVHARTISCCGMRSYLVQVR